MRRNRLIGLAVLPVLLLIGDYAYWRLAVDQLRSGFKSWTARAHDQGWDVKHGAMVIGGWPRAATLRIEELTVASSGISDQSGTVHLDNVAWGASAVLLRAGLAQPAVLDVTLEGPRPLRLSQNKSILISADQMHLRLRLRLNASPRAIDVDAARIVAWLPGSGEVSAEDFSLHAEAHADPKRDGASLSFALSTGPITLPGNLDWGLGPWIDDCALDGVLNGPMPESASDLRAWATSWRDKGGSLELHRLAIGWGQAQLEATATLALDEDLQPMGAGTGRITGYGVALDGLAAHGVLTRSAAQAAKAVLSLLATTPADGQPEQVEVPLTLQFRTLSAQQVPLVRLPELDWPRP